MSSQAFDQNLESLVHQLKTLTGLTLKQRQHPLVKHLIGARSDYYSNEKRLGCAKATYAKLAIEDLQTIAEHKPDLFRHFRKELRRQPLPLSNYFGLRLEIRMAASLITGGIPFEKSETPDFVLLGKPGVGIECTSAHLDLQCIKKPERVLYKVGSAIRSKSDLPYKTESTVLAVDVSNLLFHEGQEQCLKVLADKDKSRPSLLGQVNDSIFHSVLYFCYTWIPLEKAHGVTLHSLYSRIDRNGISAPCKDFLDSKFPLGDIWVLGGLFRTV